MSLIFRQLVGRPSLWKPMVLYPRTASSFTMTPVQNPVEKKDFWLKNKQLNRPMSPHLTIYKWQITMNLSILHRATGMGVGLLLYGGGIGSLFATGVSFPEILSVIQHNVPTFMILATKTAVAGGLLYHTLNGIRHLIWDIGYGFELKHLYLSGYVVVILTAIGTVLVFLRS